MVLDDRRPAATANVSASWKLMPHSAWSRGEDRLGRRRCRTAAPRAPRRHPRTSPSPARRRTRVVRVRASSRGRGGPGRRAGGRDRRRPTDAAPRPTGRSSGRGAGDGGRPRSTGRAAGRRPEPHAATTRRERGEEGGARATRRDWRWSRWLGSPERQDRRPRMPGTASNRAGLLPTPVRTGSGSAGLWRAPHSQRVTRSPEADMRLSSASLHRPAARPPGPSSAAPLDRRPASTSSCSGSWWLSWRSPSRTTPRHVRHPVEHRGRAHGHDGVGAAVEDVGRDRHRRETGEDLANRSCSANASAPNRMVDALPHSGSVGRARLDRRVARQAALRKAVGDRHAGQDPWRPSAPSSASSRRGRRPGPGADRTSTSGRGRSRPERT